MYEITLWSEGFIGLVVVTCAMWIFFVLLFKFHPRARKTLEKYTGQIKIASIMLIIAIIASFLIAVSYPQGNKFAYVGFKAFTSPWYMLSILVIEAVFSLKEFSRGRIDWRIMGFIALIIIIILNYTIVFLITP